MLFDTSAIALLVCNVAKPKGAKVVVDDDAGVVCFGSGGCPCVHGTGRLRQRYGITDLRFKKPSVRCS